MLLSIFVFFLRTLANIGKPSNDLHSNTQLYNSPSLLPLTKRQRRLVSKNPDVILALMNGARMAIDECKFQFRNRRWNCPTQDVGHGGSIFGKILKRGKQPKGGGGGVPRGADINAIFLFSLGT